MKEFRDPVVGALLGIVCGTLILGVGGRLAMRGIAVALGQDPGFSLAGSATVVFMGAVWGLAGAIVFMLLRRLLPRRPVLRGTLFWVVLTAATLAGLQPVDVQRIAWFFPVVVAYGALLHFSWCRLARASHVAPSEPTAQLMRPL